ncbi:MAG: histidine kinase, partial [Bacteroidota bacterium]
PKVLFKKKYFQFLLWVPMAMFGLSVFARFLNIYIGEVLLYPEVPNENLWQIVTQPQQTIDLYLGRFLPFSFWFAFIKIGIDQLRSQQKLVQLNQEKATAELRLLKAQIHPHFLFNTLNNLYTLTLEKSDKAPGVVERLSSMLDYLLYQCNTPTVPVRKEVELIENYIKLEALRYGERLELEFHHALDDDSAMVAPLMLISPVENAFKHGASGNTEQPKINISLSVKAGKLTFRVWNTVSPTTPRDVANYTDGIGLSNVRSQLNLIYPGKHNLEIASLQREYTVALSIDL